MATITIKETLWRRLVDVAKSRRVKPEALAEQAIVDYLRRVDDEELLVRSERAAQKTGLSIREAERLVRKSRTLDR